MRLDLATLLRPGPDPTPIRIDTCLSCGNRDILDHSGICESCDLETTFPPDFNHGA